MRKTKIICTLGPSSESEEKLREIMLAGMNVARFNFSHGSHEAEREEAEGMQQYEAPELEKNDVLAMVIAAAITIVPVALLVLLGLGAIFYFTLIH